MRRDFLIARSYRLAFVSDLASLLLTVITYSLVARLVDPGQVPGGYYSFAIIGLAVTNFLQVVALVASSVRQDQMMGTLEAVVASGTRLPALAAGMVTYPIVSAAARGLAFGAIALAFGAKTQLGNWPLALLGLVVGSVSFAGLSLVAAALVLLFRQAASATGWLLAGLTLAAGVLFPLRLFPAWATRAAEASPFTQTLRLAREALLQGTGWGEGWPRLATLTGMALIFVALGMATIGRGLAWARRSGSLAHY